MAIGGKIAGITVEIGGDTSGLGKALKDVNREINSTNRDLKDTNKLLKLDPTNTNLLAQKQKQLGKEIELTKNKLKALKQAEEEAKNALANGDIGEEEFQALEREIVKTEQSLQALEKSAQELKFEKITQMGQKFQDVGGKVEGVGKALLPVTAAVTGLGVASVKSTSNFETAMSQVQATLRITKGSMEELDGQTVNTMDALSDLAKEMAGETKFSASEAADGINILAMAGLNTKQIYEALPSVLALAAAGNIEMGQAASYVTGAVKGYGDEMKNAAVYADLIATGSSLANTDVTQLGTAFSSVSATANQYGQSAEGTVLSLLRLAEANVTGSEASTGLAAAMTRVYAPTKQAKDAMDELGVSAYDSDGKAKDFNVVIDELSSAMKNMGEEEANAAAKTIFGSSRLAIFNDMASTSKEKVNELSTGLKEASGSAQQMADVQIDNFSGDIEILKSKLEVLAITIGEYLMPFVTTLVEKISALVTWFTNLDSGTQKLVIVLAAVAGAIGPVLITIGKLMLFAGQIMTVWPKIAGAFTAVKGAMLAMSGPIGIVIAIIAALVAAGVLLYKNWDTIKEYASTIWEAIKEKISTVVEGIKSVIASIGEAFTGIGEFISGAFETICNVVQVGIMLVVEVIKAYVNLLLIPWKFIWENFGGVITEKFNEFKTLITTAMTAISNVIKSVWNKIKSTITPILNGIKTTVSNVWNGIKSTLSDILGKIVTAVSDKWESVKTKTAEKFDAVKTKVSDIVDKIKSKVSDGFGAAKDKAVEAFDKLKDKIKDKLDAVKSKVEDIVGKIKDKFNITLPHPKIKLPHPKISGNFSLNPPSVPKFSIDWYRKAYDTPVMFKDPTILSTAAGMKGFGDGPGGELVIGKNTLMGWFGQAMDSMLSGKMEAICSALEQMMPYIEAGTKMYINKDVLVGETAPAMNKAMGKLAVMGGRGL
ncbi:MAG: phage tail tape measure protein [Bacteroidales bacterium]|nr:phage tail tape measure protein [Candidatus Scybalousia scybalohippi]